MVGIKTYKDFIFQARTGGFRVDAYPTHLKGCKASILFKVLCGE